MKQKKKITYVYTNNYYDRCLAKRTDPTVNDGILLGRCTGIWNGWMKVKIISGKNCNKGDILYFMNYCLTINPDEKKKLN